MNFHGSVTRLHAEELPDRTKTIQLELKYPQELKPKNNRVDQKPASPAAKADIANKFVWESIFQNALDQALQHGDPRIAETALQTWWNELMKDAAAHASWRLQTNN